MRFRREDDRLNLTATLTEGSDGKITATMTSTPKAGISVEDLTGAVIKLTESSTGIVMCATLTGVMEISRSTAGMTVRMLAATGIGPGILDSDITSSLTLLHSETNGVVKEALTFNMPTTANEGS